MEQDTLSIFQKIAPDVMGTIKERYLLLRHIADAEPVGRRTLAGAEDQAPLLPEHLRILSDVYHYSRLSQNRGLMPKELAKDFDADDLRDLFLHGYLLRIRLKGRVTAKGWVVSEKGLAALSAV